ncbi:MAG: ThiF family adenylyltransferase [Thermoguttaceae bacterium]|nr:ThiF family adenylyltransferase [Thermoguttaceae bacterium]
MPDPMQPAPPLDRYIRQVRYAPLGREGQERLGAGRALVCGCGALGNMLATWLVRAGVGLVRIVDRDFVEKNNLQRQTLFDEDDADAGLPKAVAAAEKLRRANRDVAVEAIVADIGPSNIESLCDAIDVIVDGTDNFETRFLINDVAVKRGIPWVYGGCLGAEGQTMTILPGQTACLRCLLQDCPPPGALPTCDTAGILGPAVGVIASIQALEAIKILSGRRHAVSHYLTVVELWDCSIRQVDVTNLRDQVDCPTCKRGEFAWLAGQEGSRSAVLCGRNAVQLSFPGKTVSLDSLAAQWEKLGQVSRNPFLLRLKLQEYDLTVFPDGRAIISGTSDIATARTLYAKYVGT